MSYREVKLQNPWFSKVTRMECYDETCTFSQNFECILVFVIMKRKNRKRDLPSFFFVFWKSYFHSFNEFNHVLRDIENTILPVHFQIFHRFNKIFLFKFKKLTCKNKYYYNTISLSRHEQVCLIRLRFERYFSHHLPSLGPMMGEVFLET